MSGPTTTVVVCTDGDVQQLAACLSALRSQDHDDREILVVDNTGGGAAIERLAGEAGARYVVEPRRGLSRARNAGTRAARGELVAFVDDDAVPEPQWLRLLVEPFADPAVGATTGRIRPLDPRSAEHAIDLGTVPLRLDRTTPGWFEIANFGGIGAGGAMAFRRHVAAFREDLGLGTAIPGSEEHNAFFSIVRAGYAIQYVPAAVVRHPEPVSDAERARRRRRVLRSGAAYLALLVAEEPEFRAAALRYAVTGAAGRRRAWRGPGGPAVRARGRLGHGVAGVAMYLRRALNPTRLRPPP